MKLYTKTGDDGGTSLFDGSRVRKDHVRVASYGDVDELNSQIGVIRAIVAESADAPKAVAEMAGQLRRIQSDLFALGAELATPPASGKTVGAAVTAEDIARLEGLIDAACAAVPPLKTFVLPAGSRVAAQLHVCRTVSRRAERNVVHLAGIEAVGELVIIYLNRLSDLFFAWSRLANHAAGAAEEPWHPNA